MSRLSDREKTERLFNLTGSCRPPIDFFLNECVTRDAIRDFQTPRPARYSEIFPQMQRAAIAHWIVKLKVNSKHKHPFGRKAVNYKSMSSVYAAIFDACRDIHTFRGGEGYSCAAMWFSMILYEMVLCRTKLAATKVLAVAELQKINSSLTAIKNNRVPDLELEEIFDPQQTPHTYNLFVKLTTPIADADFDALRKDLLSQIINALKDFVTWVKATKFDLLVPTVEGDFVVSGRGRSHKRLQSLFFNSETQSMQGFAGLNL